MVKKEKLTVNIEVLKAEQSTLFKPLNPELSEKEKRVKQYRANIIAFTLYAAENKINPEQYGIVETCQKGNAKSRESFSSLDIVVPHYVLQGDSIVLSDDTVQIYRRLGAGAVGTNLVWNEDLLWYKIAQAHNVSPRSIIQPTIWLSSITDIDGQPTVQSAIEELEEIEKGASDFDVEGMLGL